jgi:hypothetical protein
MHGNIQLIVKSIMFAFGNLATLDLSAPTKVLSLSVAFPSSGVGNGLERRRKKRTQLHHRSR